MNTQSNAMPESLDSQRIAPAILSPTRPFYWSLRRELWENRSIYVAPLAVAAVYLFGFMISMIHLPDKMRTLAALDPSHQHELFTRPYEFAEGMLMATAMIVAIFYSLDALYGERRDRSILFWKSLPVSDLTTVLVKASVPLFILQVLAFVISVALQWIMLLLNSAVLAGSGHSAAKLWTEISPFQMWAGLFYHLMTVHALWHAPIYCWMLLVSAWARRAPFLWASLPLLAVGILERIIFNSSHFGTFLMYRLSGPQDFSFKVNTGDSMNMTAPNNLGRFLITPGLWIGLIAAALFLVLAARIRRNREPI